MSIVQILKTEIIEIKNSLEISYLKSKVKSLENQIEKFKKQQSETDKYIEDIDSRLERFIEYMG